MGRKRRLTCPTMTKMKGNKPICCHKMMNTSKILKIWAISTLLSLSDRVLKLTRWLTTTKTAALSSNNTIGWWKTTKIITSRATESLTNKSSKVNLVTKATASMITLPGPATTRLLSRVRWYGTTPIWSLQSQSKIHPNIIMIITHQLTNMK